MPAESILSAVPRRAGVDDHLADCSLAKSSGPDATLACATCGRAQWMHATRHDTCGQWCWVDLVDMTSEAIAALRLVEGLPLEQQVNCARALNDFGLAPGIVRDAKRALVSFINGTYHSARAKETK